MFGAVIFGFTLEKLLVDLFKYNINIYGIMIDEERNLMG
jgi:hypothetical protein